MVVPADTRKIRVFAGCLQLKPFPVIADEIGTFHPATLVDQGRVESVKCFLRKPMHLTDPEGIIPQIPHHLRHLVTILQGHASVSQHTMMPRRHPGQ